MCFLVCLLVCFFFFKQKTAYEMRISDWSSDVCSSDLLAERQAQRQERVEVVDRQAEGGQRRGDRDAEGEQGDQQQHGDDDHGRPSVPTPRRCRLSSSSSRSCWLVRDQAIRWTVAKSPVTKAWVARTSSRAITTAKARKSTRLNSSP